MVGGIGDGLEKIDIEVGTEAGTWGGTVDKGWRNIGSKGWLGLL